MEILLDLSCQRNSAQNGQILPLAAVILALLAALLIALTQFILKTQNNVVRWENEFQGSLLTSQAVANKLNAISTNNQHIALTLERIFSLYLSGTGHALDLAASTPLWERKLPVPIPERVYAAFEAALPAARIQLSAIQSMNDVLLSQIPQQVRERLTRASISESLCRVASSPDSLPSANNCRYRLTMSMLGFPQLRTISGDLLFTSALKQNHGFVLIQISDNVLLKKGLFGARLGSSENPFPRQSIALTHARFCHKKADFRLVKHCPKTKLPKGFPDRLSHSGNVISFEPNWSVLVDEN
ncbi:MAG: hypothetical protein RLZZ488_856 [Pseudomonadota bacterium]|jgi:hypothetical protein